MEGPIFGGMGRWRLAFRVFDLPVDDRRGAAEFRVPQDRRSRLRHGGAPGAMFRTGGSPSVLKVSEPAAAAKGDRSCRVARWIACGSDAGLTLMRSLGAVSRCGGSRLAAAARLSRLNVAQNRDQSLAHLSRRSAQHPNRPSQTSFDEPQAAADLVIACDAIMPSYCGAFADLRMWRVNAMDHDGLGPEATTCCRWPTCPSVRDGRKIHHCRTRQVVVRVSAGRGAASSTGASGIRERPYICRPALARVNPVIDCPAVASTPLDSPSPSVGR
ncbi:hypothetical protein WDL1CHR_02004 [Variovorax sp. WDL1]|nr:hypothetical protein CHC06_04443 [Variovorax sp. B2]PNG53671.1 hypothetical protein CHC07_03490 [Variovorax sp. B4]VTV11110.1 hypothetical protein WDL1CHR_02004 [Variovorax sp. WDL1]